MILGMSLAAFTALHVVISLVGIVTGIVVLLGIALFALYAQHLSGAWRWVYVVTALFALYLNCFVAVVQSFQKIPFLRALAPTQSEAPFQIAPGILLLAFVCAGIAAVRKFHPAKMSLAAEKM